MTHRVAPQRAAFVDPVDERECDAAAGELMAGQGERLAVGLAGQCAQCGQARKGSMNSGRSVTTDMSSAP